MQRILAVLVALVGALALLPQLHAQGTRATAKDGLGTFRSGGYFGLVLTEDAKDGERRVLLEGVVQGSDAARLGFVAGDVILAVDGRPVRNGDQFLQLLYGTDDALARRMGRASAAPSTTKVDGKASHRVTVLRGQDRIEVAASLPELDVRPKVGEIAPDFVAKSLDGKHDVRFADLLGKKPLVLIFGSFT